MSGLFRAFGGIVCIALSCALLSSCAANRDSRWPDIEIVPLAASNLRDHETDEDSLSLVLTISEDMHEYEVTLANGGSEPRAIIGSNILVRAEEIACYYEDLKQDELKWLAEDDLMGKQMGDVVYLASLGPPQYFQRRVGPGVKSTLTPDSKSKTRGSFSSFGQEIKERRRAIYRFYAVYEVGELAGGVIDSNAIGLSTLDRKQ